MTHAHAARAHDLTDDRTTPEQALAWHDEIIPEYDARVALLGEWQRKLKGRRGHAAEYARNHWKAELARLESVRKQKEAAVPAREQAREAYRAALDAVRAHAAKPLPDDTEGELRRIAETNVLNRRLTAAHRAFVSACQATKLPALPSMHHEFVADEETRELASKWRRLRHYEPGRVNDAVELAYTQGRTSDISVLPYYAVAEAELDIPQTRALYAVRWEAIGRKHRLPYDEVDLEAAALAAEETAFRDDEAAQ